MLIFTEGKAVICRSTVAAMQRWALDMQIKWLPEVANKLSHFLLDDIRW